MRLESVSEAFVSFSPFTVTTKYLEGRRLKKQDDLSHTSVTENHANTHIWFKLHPLVLIPAMRELNANG